MLVLTDDHVTDPVTFCAVPLLKLPVAVYCNVPPVKMDAFAGVTTTDTNTGAVTVATVEPLMEPEVARIVLVPGATPRASPVAEIVATAVLVEDQVAVSVRSWVLPSLYVPVAMNCWFTP